jgi:uncharacterized radical SAM superfamily Fe-S cluster-containing enzyme
MSLAISTSKTGKFLGQTNSLCGICKQGIPAQLVEENQRILMRKECPTHGFSEVLIASSAQWYHEIMQQPAILKAPATVRREVEQGCPFDCGACTSHQQSVYLPVIPITSACNLDCPICYTINKNQGPYHISLDEFRRILDVIRTNDPQMKIINLTGGEPTLHPQLVQIIEACHDAGIHRVTLSTHGLTFIQNKTLLSELASLQARIVLSFNSFNELVNDKMLGAKVHASKVKVLERLEEFKVDTTLIPVLAFGCNDQELGDLINLVFRYDFIRSLEIHTMTFTGQGGRRFENQARMTVPDVLHAIELQTQGKIAVSDFTPSPCAHPLCYQTCYLLNTGEKEYIPFARFISKSKIRELLTDNLYMEPGPKMERILQEAITELWANDEGDPEVQEKVLRAIKRNLQEIFPPKPLSYREQQLKAERSAKTIYLHSHMDEDNFDTDRIRQCCVGVPESDGSNTPTCSYNILYRGRDERFSKQASLQTPLKDFQGGRKW